MSAPNDELAAQVGQDKTEKDGAYAYDAKHGTYAPKPMPTPAVDAGPRSTVDPIVWGK